MDHETVAIRLRQILANKISFDSQIDLGCHLQKDLGLDSLDLAELNIDIEREFKIKIDESESDHLLTYQSLLNYVINKCDEGNMSFEPKII